MRVFLTLEIDGTLGGKAVSQDYSKQVRSSVSRRWTAELMRFMPDDENTVIQDTLDGCELLLAKCAFLSDWCASARRFARARLPDKELRECVNRANDARSVLAKGEAWSPESPELFPRASKICGKSIEELRNQWKATREEKVLDSIALLHAYLTLAAGPGIIGQLDRQLILRRERKKDKWIAVVDHPNASPRLYDVKEGTYTWSPDARREHFMRRSAFVRSFVDMAERLKIVDTSFHWWQNQ
jgi:hypothetical protein